MPTTTKNHLFSWGCFLLVSTLLFNCQAPSENLEDYSKSILDWQEERNAEMRDTSGSWLSLVGLHWLEQGQSSFGADSSNTLIFPNTGPAFAGSFILNGEELILKVTDGVSITQNGQAVKEMVLKHDMDENTTYLQMGSIRFYALSRPEGIAIRVKDSKSPDLLAFEDIPNFEIDPDWKIEAELQWFDAPQAIQIPTVLGSERTQNCPARIVFEVEGETYELSPYQSFYGDPVWTVIFSDLTNGESTYGGGRFLSLEEPAPDAKSIILDFNKAYNPPCSFSAFATCPLPPPENRLAVAIPAGEENYGVHH
ncbi:MAG: DUF1684 domain-containing protein [Bacteroidota bacterium]